MHLANSESPKSQQFLSGLVASVGEMFATPTVKYLTVRCIARSELIHLLGSFRDSLAVPGYKKISGSEMLKMLVDSGVVSRVPTDQHRQALPVDPLYAVGLGADPTFLSPLEVLQALRPAGVICYFTALTVHGLTTQLPTHHHIADVHPSASVAHKPNPAGLDDEMVREPTFRDQQAPPTLGTLEFSFQGIPYYSTQRDSNRVLGTQIRFLSEKSQYRITTLEQTLLDTLHRPMSCGGPSIVFEAWEAGMPQINLDSLVGLCEKISDQRLLRRTGYMLSQQISADDADNVLSRIKSLMNSEHTSDIIPLMPGIPFQNVDTQWGVAIP